ncbi:RnfABCDGE type electron transport complex subunit G [Labilibaculum euxinus]|uniref:Ion-translocating oxidoreductase complex subunit G n=1 Tax=Labilibaculum euxinus TaxID=2686357 RepID=A0A7M4D4B4_9BACT|nr:RnfABCDGE type electron transport complex subunit G [Labilibaculum euxinus]MUP37493.1 RnfABCDGE type electron transport complex subunit G [Labilibaculum euxinus]MVB06698.1 RnfABCDGE type electron transport complex subunit G [Labilibaculum euxinus]
MAGKKESTFTNMVLVLFVITLIASAALGAVYEITKEPIAKAKLAKKLNAIKEVVPEFNNNPSDEMYKVGLNEKDTLEFYPAKKDGILVGTAVKTLTTKGFGGNVWIMVGFEPDGTIHNYSVLEHTETPGLGTKMVSWFKPTESSREKSSVINKNPGSINFTVSKDGGDIDAITAATISSRAFLDAIKTGYDEYMKKNNNKEEISNE